MYSYKQRITAVKLYIKLEHRSAEVQRLLGYPSKKLIRRWFLQFEQDGDLPKSYKRAPRFTKAQKQKAVDFYISNGRSIALTVRELGYPSRAILRGWLQDYQQIQVSNHKVTALNDKKPKYAEQNKKDTVIAFCLRETTATDFAKKIGISRQVLYKWKHQLLSDSPQLAMKKSSKTDASQAEMLDTEIKALQLKMRALQLENDILKKANELVKKDLGINLEALTNREKTILIDALLAKYSLRELMDSISIPRSSYFYHKARLSRPEKYATMRLHITAIFNENRHCYGYRRVHAALQKSGTRLAEKVIRRIMKEQALNAHCSRKKRNYSSYYGEISPAVENVVNREFTAQKPNEKWLTDITEFRIASGKVYLSPIIDCFDGMVVSWSIGTRPTAELTNSMLDNAVSILKTNEHPIIHSDRGAHYRWPSWIERMNNASLTRSMSKKACSPDNAACEAFFGKLKTEFFYALDWSKRTVEELIIEIDTYIHWFNTKRIKLSLGGKSPLEYRKSIGIIA